MAADDTRPALGSAVAFGAAVSYLWLVPAGPGFRDAGELGAAAQAIGVPHPTGFPLDMLALRAATLLPLGSLAFRQNLAVALISAAALGLLAEVTAWSARRAGLPPSAAPLAGGFAALCLGTWATFLGTGLVVEVYSTALAVSLLALHAVLVAPQSAHRTSGLMAGLALSMHVTARLFVLPVWLGALLRRGRTARALGASVALALLGIAAVAYLPLASLRDPPMDWGDPQTLARLWEHVSAARIRAAFEGEMGHPGLRPAAALGGQLMELWPAIVPGLLAIGWGARRAPASTLVALAVIGVDGAFALVLHPMGIEARQVGHTAGAAICGLGGLGVAVAWSLARAPGTRAAVGTVVGSLAALAVLGAPPGLGRDGDVAGELLGSGGSLLWLPPRAIAVCSSDDVCAGALFARHAEGVRPDIAVVPGQHLWEPSVRRHVAGSLSGSGIGPDLRPAEAMDRAGLAQRALDHLGRPDGPRPVVWEGGGAARPLGVALVPRRAGGWLSVGSASTDEVADTLAELRSAYRARVGTRPAESAEGRGAWSRAFEGVGRGALEAGSPALAVASFEAAVEVAPERAVAWSNLSVARGRSGDLDGAIGAATRAIELDPDRAAAWVNLARYVAARGDVVAARAVLDQARRAGIVDPRIEALRRQLGRRADPSPNRIGHDR